MNVEELSLVETPNKIKFLLKCQNARRARGHKSSPVRHYLSGTIAEFVTRTIVTCRFSELYSQNGDCGAGRMCKAAPEFM